MLYLILIIYLNMSFPNLPLKILCAAIGTEFFGFKYTTEFKSRLPETETKN